MSGDGELGNNMYRCLGQLLLHICLLGHNSPSPLDPERNKLHSPFSTFGVGYSRRM